MVKTEGVIDMQVIEFHDKKYVSTADAKAYLGVETYHLYNLINYHRRLKTKLIGGNRHVTLDSLLKLKAAGDYMPRGKK